MGVASQARPLPNHYAGRGSGQLTAFTGFVPFLQILEEHTLSVTYEGGCGLCIRRAWSNFCAANPLNI